MKAKRTIGIVIGLIIIILVSYLTLTSLADDKTYSGEFIKANKVYMPDNNIKLVLYFNETPDTKFLVFDDWDARHSIQLSNMAEGSRVKIFYKEYVVGGDREITRIELL